ncbi:TetR/AcrR family transcriptional regulator [Mycobacterium cookii]|uniref:TetR family transcriptional regulator n=1 Tax=Mycobacterium cookii TaxID=1775 RepID=A0A7I7L2W4_9MYCO|nr:TetR/AcrR family transcriptional regulator [Mycobacterium cookii]MCV7329003.1 TetR/AcrR family transcriptional regulator [Mycobacterium cookii]BBX48329.1 TetR family transcriptional regulator [Mycobacterium cookii]
MNPGDGSTRDRLLDAAIALFSSQGYASTSIAEIQQACGLSPGSGALYKHFPSKNALLREATQRQVDRIIAAREEHDRTRPADTREALRRAAERIWDTIETNSELLRVMYREPEAIEGFSAELWSAVTASAYDRMGAALSGATAAGASQVEDPEASAALLLASIAYFPIVRMLIEQTPGNISADRYREAWLRLAESVFTGRPPT